MVFRLVLYLILAAVIVRALSRLFEGILEGAGYRRQSGPPGVKLVRDPVCGVFVVPSKALTAVAGSEVLYFCSEKCRRAWKAR
jgi:YHS domain-containing protein